MHPLVNVARMQRAHNAELVSAKSTPKWDGHAYKLRKMRELYCRLQLYNYFHNEPSRLWYHVDAARQSGPLQGLPVGQRETGKREPWKSWMPRKDATNIRLNVMPKWHRAVWIYSHAVQTELYNSSALLLQPSRFVQDILTPQSPCRLYVYEYQRSTSFSTTNKPKRSRNEQKSLEGKKESQFREIMQWSQGPWLTAKKIQKENLGNIARYMRERLVLGKLIVSAARIQEDSGPCFLCCTIALLQSFEFSSTFSPVARGAQPMLR